MDNIRRTTENAPCEHGKLDEEDDFSSFDREKPIGFLAGLKEVTMYAAKNAWNIPWSRHTSNTGVLYHIVYKPLTVVADLFSLLNSGFSPSIKFLANVSSSLETTLGGALSFFDLLNLPGNLHKSIKKHEWGTVLLDNAALAVLEFGDIQAMFTKYKPDWSSLKLPLPLSLASRALQADLSKYLPTVGISLGLFRIWTNYQKIQNWNRTVSDVQQTQFYWNIETANIGPALTIAGEVTFLARNLLQMASSSKLSRYTQLGLLTASAAFKICAFLYTSKDHLEKREGEQERGSTMSSLTRLAAIAAAATGVAASTLYLWTPNALQFTASKSVRLAAAAFTNLAGVAGLAFLAHKLTQNKAKKEFCEFVDDFNSWVIARNTKYYTDPLIEEICNFIVKDFQYPSESNKTTFNLSYETVYSLVGDKHKYYKIFIDRVWQSAEKLMDGEKEKILAEQKAAQNEQQGNGSGTLFKIIQNLKEKDWKISM